MLKALKQAIDEAADDAYCLKLYQDYLNDSAQGDFVSFQDALEECGVSSDELGAPSSPAGARAFI